MSDALPTTTGEVRDRQAIPDVGSSLITHHSSLSARRAEIEAKQEQVAKMLVEAETEALMLLDPANLAWFTGAAVCQGIADPADWPALFLTTNQRWLLAGSTDSQRLFDEHLDCLGFQLKEWPWDRGRDRLLNDLRQNRQIAADRVMPDSMPLGPTLRRVRCQLTNPEQARMHALGTDLAHALEATCRNIEPGQSEAEVAGHLSHRLVRHGIQPVALAVAADDRARHHLRPGVTAAIVHSSCLVAATAARFGLHVTAARTVCFGPANELLRSEFGVASQTVAALAAATAPGIAAAAVLNAGEGIAHLTGNDDAWRTRPPGNVTGWQAVERPLPPGTPMIFDAGWAVTWRAGIGAAYCADTFLVAAPVVNVTSPEVEFWPVLRLRVQGRTLDVPDLLVQ